MLDTLRRILLGDEVRPIDVTMLVVELLVLLLIFAEFVWQVAKAFRKWREDKQYESEIIRSLSTLDVATTDALKRLLLHGTQPPDEIGQALQGRMYFSLIERDFTGWKVRKQNRKFLERWAKRKP